MNVYTQTTKYEVVRPQNLLIFRKKKINTGQFSNSEIFNHEKNVIIDTTNVFGVIEYGKYSIATKPYLIEIE